jgi:hypothetical protein
MKNLVRRRAADEPPRRNPPLDWRLPDGFQWVFPTDAERIAV